MNKTELANAIAQKNNLTQKQGKEILDSITDLIVDTVKTGEDIAIPGFGTFKAKEYADRTGRNPHTGETMTIPACKKFSFVASKSIEL